MECPMTSTVNSIFMEELKSKNEEFVFHMKNAFACMPQGNCCKCHDLPNETKEYFLNNYPDILCKFMNLKAATDSVIKPTNICGAFRDAEINRWFIVKLSEEFEKEMFKAYNDFNKNLIAS